MMELNIFILLKQHDHDLTQMFMKRQGQGESVAGGIKAKKQKIGRKTRWKKRWRRRWRRRGRKKIDGTVGQINQKYRLKNWATRSSARSFAHTAHFAHSLARGTVNDWIAILSVFFFYFGP